MTVPEHTASGAGEPGIWSTLFSPQGLLGRRGMGALTILAVLGGLAASRAGIRFDGFLDVHLAWNGAPVPLATALLDQFVALPLAAVIALAVCRAWGSRPNLIRLLLALGTARVPLVLASPIILTLPTPGQLPYAPLEPTAMIATAAIVAVVAIAWMVTLIVTGLGAVTGLKGGRLAGAVITLILAAEIAGKLLLAVA